MAELLAVALLIGKSGEKAEAVDEAAEVSNRRANGRDPNEAVNGARSRTTSSRTSSKMALETHLFVFTAPARR
jgi:hypothetical protein